MTGTEVEEKEAQEPDDSEKQRARQAGGLGAAADGASTDATVTSTAADAALHSSTTPVRSPSSSSPPPPDSPRAMSITMPAVLPADLTLHSPSSHIIGTPFAVSSPPFEYPFPDSSPSSPDIPPRTSSPSLSNLSSTSQPSLISPISGPALPFSSSFHHLPSVLPSYSAAHPKLRSGTPPMPPNLAKRRHKFWTLNITSRTRRRSDSINGAYASPDIGDSGAPSISSIASAIISGSQADDSASSDVAVGAAADHVAPPVVLELRRVVSSPDNLGSLPSSSSSTPSASAREIGNDT